MNYKLKELILNNFKGSASEMKIIFSNNITHIIGMNGSGKSMIGNAIQFLHQGKSYFSSKYRSEMITDDAKGLGVIAEYINIKTGNTIKVTAKLSRKDNPSLKIESSDEKEITKEDLNEMLDLLFFRPMYITKLSPKEQALLVGVDTSDNDNLIKAAKENLKPYRAEVNMLKTLISDKKEPEKVEKVNLSSLYKEKDEIRIFNDNQSNILKEKETLQRKKESIITNIENLQLSLNDINEELTTLPEIKEKKSLENIQTIIDNAETTNKKAELYLSYMKEKENLAEAEKKYETNNKLVTQAKDKKLEYIKSCKLPFPNVKFDDDGGLVISAFNYKDKNEYVYLNEDFYSKGQIMKIAIGMLTYKILKIKDKHDVIPFLLIDDADLLDDNLISYINDIANKNEIQVVYLLVGDEPQEDKFCIMMEEKKIKEYVQPKTK